MSKEKAYKSIPEVAKILGISRIAVYKKVKKGDIKATKVGRNYVIPSGDLDDILRTTLKVKDKEQIDAAVIRTVKEYGETLKLLGRE